PCRATVEALTGLDLAALHTHLSRGGRLDGAAPPEPRGHALQVPLSARDPEAGFAPSPGVVDTLRVPAGPGLRADAAVEEGEVPAEPDLEIVRLTASGRSRSEALGRLQDGLARTVALVHGGTTDKPFLSELLDRSEVEDGTADPAWLARLVSGGEHLARRGAEAALLDAAALTYQEEVDQARGRFFASAARGRPEVPGEIGGSVELRYRGRAYPFRVARLARDLYRVEPPGLRLEIALGPESRTGRRLTCGGRTWRVFATRQGRSLLIEVDGVPHRVDRGAARVVRSPAPAVVTSLAVAAGDEVAAGAPLAVLEAMKMETTLVAPAAGRVARLLVRRNVQVPLGAPILELEPASGAVSSGSAASEAPVRFDALPQEPGARTLGEVRRLMLGYDYEPAAVERLVTGGVGGSQGADGDAAAVLAILRAFVDIGALFRRPGAREEEGRHSAEEYLFTYLRDLDAGGEGLPPAFLDDLRRALAHYGVDVLGRSPRLEESLFRIAISHSRLARQVPPVLALLEGCLESGQPLGGDDLRGLLDRMIAESQGREPALYDLAREVRYRCFDRPILLASQERILAAAEKDLARLATSLPAGERSARIKALVEYPQPLHHRLSMRFAEAGPHLREAMLEVMVRRYYRIREIGDVRVRTVGDQSLAITDYDYQEERIRLLATHAEHERLASQARALRGLAEEARRDGRDVVIDLYARRADGPLADAEAAAEVADLLASPGFPRGLQRVAVALSSPAGVQHFTFRRTDNGGYAEDAVYRGIHPMMARRMELWRLSNFHLQRLPAPEGVYLFHGRAQENPGDERLFALAEVRELTVRRDEAARDGAGRVGLPQLEHTLMEALAGMRRFQARRAAGDRLQWNRVLLNLWPVIDLEMEELRGMVERLSPLTEGLGIEKVAIRCRIPDRETREPRAWVLEISNFAEGGLVLRFRKPSDVPLKPLREYAQKVIELRRRGLTYPYELVKRLAPSRDGSQGDLPPGDFAEHDLDAEGRLVPVHRPYGQNRANVVVGVVRSFTGRYPEGITRVIVLGDPSRGMGSLAEPECRRIVAAIELAGRMGVSLEWFAVSAGARISMESGTENMDWIGLVLRRLVEFTQAGGEVNVVVLGIN
ncbi:MAG TPA: biotin/lipoyl-containing protein, partial [Thermoanaerobaculia bacterium]|nr:biotin/lipoyl-containing protein [Thermoanaerobaculia bacterium]